MENLNDRNLSKTIKIPEKRILIYFLILFTFSSCTKKFIAFPDVEKKITGHFFDQKIPVGIKEKVKNSRLTAFIYVSALCPICSKCAVDLQESFESVKGSNVTFYAIFPNRDKKSEIKNFKNYYNLNFPLYQDKDKVLTRFFNVEITPLAVVVDKDANVIYHGALDNRNIVPRFEDQELEKYFLNAIHSYLNGTEIQVQKTIPVGCHVH